MPLGWGLSKIEKLENTQRLQPKTITNSMPLGWGLSKIEKLENSQRLQPKTINNSTPLGWGLSKIDKLENTQRLQPKIITNSTPLGWGIPKHQPCYKYNKSKKIRPQPLKVCKENILKMPKKALKKSSH
jgi:hypothetical protein